MYEHIHVLGICGSPVKGGNTEWLLQEGLKAIENSENVTTEWVTTAGRKIRDCDGCNWCMTHQDGEKWCAYDDGMTEIYKKYLSADAVVFATPVYSSTMSGFMHNVMDRLRAFAFMSYRGLMKNKPCATMAVAWLRGGGIETAQISLIEAFLAEEAIPVSVHHTGAFFGAGAVSSVGGAGEFDPKDRLQVRLDDWGVKQAHDICKRLVEVARLLKAGERVIREKGGNPHIFKISEEAEEFFAKKFGTPPIK